MSNNIVFFGDVALDEYYETPYFPSLKDKIIVHTLKPEMGGMIANAASVFAGYGGSPFFIAALNKGYISQYLCNGLEKAGINVDYMIWDEKLPDSKTIIILAENEHTVFIPTMGIKHLELTEQAYDLIKECKFIYSNFCELQPVCYKNKGIFDILDDLKKNGTKLWCDIDVADIGQDDLRFFDFTNVVFLNEIGKNRLEDMAKKNIDAYLFSKGVEIIVVTEAEKGCVIYQKDKPLIKIGGIKVDVKDVTGAGDTFNSTFMYSYLKTDDVLLSAEFANFAGARSVTIQGARGGCTNVKTVLEFIEATNSDSKKYTVLL